MRKITAAGLLAAGAIAVGAEAHNYATTYSAERIWSRQSALIERRHRRQPSARDDRLEQLRRGITLHKDAPRLEKCVFEDNFAAETMAGGDSEAAAKLIARRSYQPHAHCADSEQLTRSATKWHTALGFLAMLAGIVSLARSAYKRFKHGKRPEPRFPIDGETGT